MSDPITAAVAGAVANHSVAKIRELIESAEDPEHVWGQALYELCIKIKTSYEQNTQAGQMVEDRFKMDLLRCGDMARELAIRGQIRGFDEETIGMTQDLADSAAEVISVRGLGSKTMAGKYSDEGMDQLIAEIIDRTGP